MKKWMTLIAAALILTLPGCTGKETEAPPTTFETTIPYEPTVLTTIPPKEYPETIEEEILVEGEPDRLKMNLFDGGNYVVYIPEGAWIQETLLEDGLLTDRWTYEINENLTFTVTSCGNLTAEEAEQLFTEKYGENFRKEEEGHYSISDPGMQTFQSLYLTSDGKNTFALHTRMPVEFGDGFSPRFQAMRNSFEIK